MYVRIIFEVAFDQIVQLCPFDAAGWEWRGRSGSFILFFDFDFFQYVVRPNSLAAFRPRFVVVRHCGSSLVVRESKSRALRSRILCSGCVGL